MGKNARTMNRRDKRRQLPQKGLPTFQGNRLPVARATNVDVHVKACFEICRTIRHDRGFHPQLEKVLLIDSDRPDIRAKAGDPVPPRFWQQEAQAFRSFHGRSPQGWHGSRSLPREGFSRGHQVANSAMDNARHQHEDIDAEDMIITHIAAHRGPSSVASAPCPWPSHQEPLPATSRSSSRHPILRRGRRVEEHDEEKEVAATRTEQRPSHGEAPRCTRKAPALTFLRTQWNEVTVTSMLVIPSC